MPAFPPVTDGLSVWLCSDTNVDFQLDGTVVSWGASDVEGVRAAAIGSSRPQWLENQINGYPVLRFAGGTGAVSGDGCDRAKQLHVGRGGPQL